MVLIPLPGRVKVIWHSWRVVIGHIRSYSKGIKSRIAALGYRRREKWDRRSVMNEQEKTIGSLMKISLLLEAGTGAHQTDLTAEPIPFEFIFGAGSQGLSPFEFELAGKKEGDKLSIPLRPGELSGLFQHLLVPFPPIPEDMSAFFLKVQIVKVTEAEPKEVIKAMAEAAACGDHCCGQ
jgi:hypothetical protein